jgi:hypothetical protein
MKTALREKSREYLGDRDSRCVLMRAAWEVYREVVHCNNNQHIPLLYKLI